ncbi:hypothetical protein TRIATDRAFT_52337 [Trichoderma atroviride IMI 206040]|uniref:DUF8035 domain-containing protein n=1 Tax=Hypocrea atroviridis (strain ATCC 20476 / IMI 206040) TaxID=452589 RepID=G9NPA9_HYPAI|nr:uncharacterized protein TRIATDRAFT_52337 [Trichoderma atroviride IMI 206040]EHK47381.1 hypothetical protein TRIATDRAFT_52337 [Trichoderma atroviride IMI 206040]
MTDRSYRYPAAGRSATFNNPARISLPSVGGYGALYANDPDYVASPTRYAAAAATPRGYTTAAAPAGAVVPPPRSYSTVNPEPRAPRPPPPREQSRNRRSNTVDASARPPIIVTTMQDHRPHTSSALTTDALAHAASPVRDAYRASEGRLYSQPASSIRSRSTARPYHTSTNSDDFGRSREQGEIVLASRDADAYRSSRPHVVYPSNSRHSNAAIDYGDEGYQYTNAGELVRYDLDHGVAPAPRHSRRHESFDRGYSRPNINYNADQRSFNVNTTMDPSRTSRPYDSRGGPPPSVRGFDKINRAYDIPPLAPAPPNSSSSGQLDMAAGSTDRRTVGRPRPVSLIQEPGSRPEDYYRGYEDDEYDPRRFYDESVAARGFGLRPAQTDDLQDHHDRYWDPRDDQGREGSARRDHSRRIEAPPKEGQRSHSDEERVSDREREDYYRGYKDNLRERLDGRRDGDSEDNDRSRARDKVAAGLGAGAAATAAVAGAIASSNKKEEKPEPSESRRRRGSDEAEERDRERDLAKADDAKADAKADAETKDRSKRDAEAKSNGDSAAIVSSDSDEGRTKSARRHRPSHSFNPYDTGDLRQIREQLADSEKDKAEPNGKGRSSPPAKEDRRSESPSGEDNRGRDLVVVRSPEEKQVRVVSPPHEKKEDKPLKGILKQPSAKFPEEPNPIREGVAPHKEDKKLKEVPSGARWTKINRKIVNPEALDIGKERYEIRDDFVIVLRVLSKEEIQTYANATQVLRERRRNKDYTGEYEDSDRDRSDRDRDHHGREYDREYDEKEIDRDYGREYDREYEREYEDDRGRRGSHRHRRHRDDADGADVRERDQDHDRDRERRRRHRRDEEEEYDSRPRDVEHHHHHRAHREI